MRNVLSKLLPSEYACKWCVKSGAQALEYCQVAKTTPDYILIDMSMKDMSGVDVIRAIREKNNSIILIGMTSYDCRSYASSVAQVGGQAMVAKDNFKGLAEALQYCNNQHAYGCRCVKDVAYDFATPQESFIRLSKSRSKKLHVSNRVQAISAFAAMQNREQNSNLSYAYNSPQNHPNFLQETDNAC